MAGASKKRTTTRRTRAVKDTVSPKKKAAIVREATTKVEKAEKAKKLLPPVAPKRPWYHRTPKDERPVYPKLPNVFVLTKQAVQLVLSRWKLILGIAAVYGILNLLLVRGLSGGANVGQLKSDFSQLFHGGIGNVVAGFSVFALLFSTNSSGASASAGTYQSFLVLITSLALVWTYRRLVASEPPALRVRDGFYQGMYPLVPAILTLLVLCVQLIPIVLGAYIFAILVAQGIAITGAEITLSVLFLLAMIALSLYLAVSTVFALYIVTLPDMTPRQALKSAKKLVRFRRTRLISKLLYLPLAIFIVLGAIIVPVILVFAPLAQWIFLILSIFILPVVHAYIFTLYRELLHE